ncbi:phospholipase D-like domain-containing protein [Thaumasiovibrio subtropicus]|uniref:phospholipase D-like domain-containing protein n=1 Tax=Thaumasiovibrio subtropicus TaxID=1891207 RepID=UPI001C866025|nr:phospholipase D family protein [Thaumasiovibrio subtropicus]
MNRQTLPEKLITALFSHREPLQAHHAVTSYCIPTDKAGKLRDAVQKQRGNQADSLTGHCLLHDPFDALAARIALIRNAEFTIDLQYYIYRNDTVGKLLAAELIKAAERGVRVRALIDDFGSQGLDDSIIHLHAHPNIEVRLFNAFCRKQNLYTQLLFGFGNTSRRMHNKSLTADNQVSIIGGRNIGDEYFGANPNVVFDDLDVLVTNPAADDISTAFDSFWNSSRAMAICDVIKEAGSHAALMAKFTAYQQLLDLENHNSFLRTFFRNPFLAVNDFSQLSFHWANAEVKADDVYKVSLPRCREDVMLSAQLMPLIESIEQQLVIVSPYFVPGEQGVAFFEHLTEKGIEVIIVTNSLASNDVPIVHAGYAKYRKALLKAGVNLYEIDGSVTNEKLRKSLPKWFASRSSLHAKFFVFDQAATFIGSFNFDPRSFFENTEIGVTLHCPALAIDTTDKLVAALRNGAFKLSIEKGSLSWRRGQQTCTKEPHTSWIKRVSNRLMGYLPIESQL